MKLKNLEGIETLIFDFGGVLLDLDLQTCVENFKKIGFENIADFLSPHLQKGMFLGIDSGSISSAQFYDEVRVQIGKNVSDKEIEFAWTSMLTGIPQYKLDFIKELKKHYRIVMLSNINEIDWLYILRKFFSNGLDSVKEYFDKTYLSFEMGCVKPSPEIFEMILSSEGTPASKMFFLDDAVKNCQCAASFGIKSYMPKPKEDWRHLFEV